MFHALRDACRSNLNPYLARALDVISLPPGARIADLGCGSGVSALEIARLADCTLFAADQDGASLERLKIKLKSAPNGERITVIHSPVEKLKLPEPKMDLVLSEGLFNLIGFAKGLDLSAGFLGFRGYLIIHDNQAGRREKLSLIAGQGFELLESLALSREVWRKHYFDCLARGLEELEHTPGGPEPQSGRRLVEEELKYFQEKPGQCASVYYILRRKG